MEDIMYHHIIDRLHPLSESESAKQTGNTFKHLLRLRRLQQAAYLLEHTSFSIVKIMNDIGYENSTYFYRIFQDKFQCSPQEHRRKHSFPKKQKGPSL